MVLVPLSQADKRREWGSNSAGRTRAWRWTAVFIVCQCDFVIRYFIDQTRNTVVNLTEFWSDKQPNRWRQSCKLIRICDLQTGTDLCQCEFFFQDSLSLHQWGHHFVTTPTELASVQNQADQCSAWLRSGTSSTMKKLHFLQSCSREQKHAQNNVLSTTLNLAQIQTGGWMETKIYFKHSFLSKIRDGNELFKNFVSYTLQSEIRLVAQVTSEQPLEHELHTFHKESTQFVEQCGFMGTRYRSHSNLFFFIFTHARNMLVFLHFATCVLSGILAKSVKITGANKKNCTSNLLQNFLFSFWGAWVLWTKTETSNQRKKRIHTNCQALSNASFFDLWSNRNSLRWSRQNRKQKNKKEHVLGKKDSISTVSLVWQIMFLTKFWHKFPLNKIMPSKSIFFSPWGFQRNWARSFCAQASSWINIDAKDIKHSPPIRVQLTSSSGYICSNFWLVGKPLEYLYITFLSRFHCISLRYYNQGARESLKFAFDIFSLFLLKHCVALAQKNVVWFWKFKSRVSGSTDKNETKISVIAVVNCQEPRFASLQENFDLWTFLFSLLRQKKTRSIKFLKQ